MTLDLSGLEALKNKRAAKSKPEWSPLELSSLRTGTYLAADPSLTAFGLVLFEVDAEHRCAVHMTAKFTTEAPLPGDPQGHEDTLRRARQIYNALNAWLGEWVWPHDWGNVKAVHEAPPMGNLKHSKFEYSLITGFAFRQAVFPTELLPMVRRQDHARLICGNPDATKPFHHAALKDLFDEIRGADELVTNEAHRDALSVALAAAKRGF